MIYLLAKDTFTKNDIIKLFNYIRNKFTLKFITFDKPIKHYKGDLKDSKITFVNTFKNDKFIKKKYNNTNVLIEYFVEDIRIECKNLNIKKSPKQYYIDNKKKVDKKFKYLMTKKKIKKNDKVKKYNLYKSIIKNEIKKDCDLFPLFVPLFIYCTFKPRKVLDMSSGWGDRLMCSLLYGNCSYTGVDPNSKMQPRYKNIIDTFSKNNKNTFKVIESPFEDVKLTGKYDLMFSSPPYFNAEQYSDDANQSFKRYSNIDLWLDKFMFKSIDKIWKHLIIGGFLILIINDTYIINKVVHFTDQIMKYILTKNGSKFINMLKYKNDKVVQPIWIFQKLPTIRNYIVNRPFQIIPVKTYKKTFNIIREDLLISGSKQRIIIKKLKNIKEHNIFYRGPVNGYAQIALAYGCNLLNKQCHLILNKQYDNKIHKLTYIAKIFGAEIHQMKKEINKEKEQKVINNIISKYNDTYSFSLGFHSEESIKDLIKIFKNLKDKIGNPKRMWVTASTGTITDALYKVFPETLFMIVFVGHQREDYFNKKRMKVFISPQKFRQHPNILPPYRSEPSYDGKIWQFIKKNGKNNDYIFNVGGVC